MPPEMHDYSHNESDPKLDIWAMGIMLYVMLMGRFPFEGDSKQDLKKAILERPVEILWSEAVSAPCRDLI